jgi:hypothetical protein
MAIKFLRGIYKADQLKTTRPVGFKFPLGLKLSNTLETANSSTTATIGTFDILVVGGGGSSGIGGPGQSGGGGGGGVRFFTANSFSEMPEFKNPTFITGTTNFIPVVVGGTAGRSCLSSAFIACGGGTGGSGQWGSNNGEVGGSGGGGGRITCSLLLVLIPVAQAAMVLLDKVVVEQMVDLEAMLDLEVPHFVHSQHLTNVIAMV